MTRRRSAGRALTPREGYIPPRRPVSSMATAPMPTEESGLVKAIQRMVPTRQRQNATRAGPRPNHRKRTHRTLAPAAAISSDRRIKIPRDDSGASRSQLAQRTPMAGTIGMRYHSNVLMKKKGIVPPRYHA